MAKLYFVYSAMNAGKTTGLLQVAYNYEERGMHAYLMTAKLDTRTGTGTISSRIGLNRKADTFYPGLNLELHIEKILESQEIDCILIDECQFLERAQVDQLSAIVDKHNIPVMCYGLRTDFQGEFFSGSARLLAIADELREIRTICFCGRKASMVLRIDGDGIVISDGAQIEIGGNDRYISVCRAHWMQKKPFASSPCHQTASGHLQKKLPLDELLHSEE